METQTPDLVTLKEAMDIIGISRTTLLYHIEHKRFNVYKEDKHPFRVYLPRAEVEEHANKSKRPVKVRLVQKRGSGNG